MLSKEQHEAKRETNSSKIGDSHDNLTVLASFRRSYTSWFTVKCDICGWIFDTKATTWAHLRHCPMCKTRVRRNPNIYMKYRWIKTTASKQGIFISAEWSSFEAFLKWCESRDIDKTYRMRIDKNITQLSPETVHFYKK